MGIGISDTITSYWPHQRRGSTIIKVNKTVSVKLTAYPNGVPKLSIIHNSQIRDMNNTGRLRLRTVGQVASENTIAPGFRVIARRPM